MSDIREDATLVKTYTKMGADRERCFVFLFLNGSKLPELKLGETFSGLTFDDFLNSIYYIRVDNDFFKPYELLHDSSSNSTVSEI